jgi:hypothetical protein
MASATRMRKEGQRKLVSPRSKMPENLISNSVGISTGGHAEQRLNLSQILAIEHMFQGNPAVQAARTVLSGQLLSGGISLRKNGKNVELQPIFKNHLNEVWLPFAQDVIDCYLKWGFVVVAYEDFEEERNPRRLNQNKKRKAGKEEGSMIAVGKAEEMLEDESSTVIPVVPMLGSYEVSFQMGGRSGYIRKYKVYSCSNTTGVNEDESAQVVVRQHPDQAGNVNSPLASVFELGSFVAAITELAIVAESSRARPHMITQMRKKDPGALDPGNLFFDSESRAVQSGADNEESNAQARALQLQHRLCDMINQIQTRQYGNRDATGLPNSGRESFAPPEVQPSLFHLPKDHELCPNIQNPESRGDLEALSRLSIEQLCAAMGVPSDLIFSGRYAGKSTSQLSLLNTTVKDLAKAVNNVMTIAYKEIYSQSIGEDVGQLQLLTSPIAATDEVLNLFNGGLVPINIAMPSVMHAIGATKDDIDSALQSVIDRGDIEKKYKLEQKEISTNADTLSLQENELRKYDNKLTNNGTTKNKLQQRVSTKSPQMKIQQ